MIHALPSLHAVPSALTGSAGHLPVVESHVTAVWHWSGLGHTTVAPLQMPLLQTSPVVHSALSLQAVPLVLFAAEHKPVEALHVGTLWH